MTVTHMALEQRLAALLTSHPEIADWALAPRAAADGRRIDVLYVVPARARAAHEWREAAGAILSSDTAAWHVALVSALPFASNGQLDLAALATLPLIDATLARNAAAQTAEALGVECAGFVVGSNLASAPYHASLLIPRPFTHTTVRTASEAGPDSRPVADGPPAIIDGGALPGDDALPATLLATLQDAARSAQGALIVLTADNREIRVEYAELLQRARTGAAQLIAAGLSAGTPVLLQFEDLLDFFEGFWACIAAGVIPVQAATLESGQRGAAARMHAIWNSLDRPPVLTQRSLHAALSEALSDDGAAPRLLMLDRDSALTGAQLHAAAADDIALMMLTSGSTGTPKAVPLSHRNLISRSRGSQLVNGYTAALRSLNWMPLDHVAGLFLIHLRDVFLGATQVHVPTAAVLREPLRWLDLCEQYQINSSFAPNFAFGLVNTRGAELVRRRWDLSRLWHIMNGGEAIVARTAREFMQLLMPHGLPRNAMVPIWGMSEISSGITYDRDFDCDRVRDEDRHVSVGRPLPGTRVRIVDAEDRVVAQGVEGRLQAQGATAFAGYWRGDNDNVFTPDGWFRTGDLAYVQDGELFITGREKDTIIIGGVKYPGPAIEAAVDTVPGVVPSFSAALAVQDAGLGAELLAVTFVPEYDRDSALRVLLPAIRRRVSTQLGVAPDLLLPLSREQVPKTSIGKIQRRQMQNAFASGEFDAARRRFETLTGSGDSLPRWFHRRQWRCKAARGAVPSRSGALVCINWSAQDVAELRAALAGVREVRTVGDTGAALLAACQPMRPALLCVALDASQAALATVIELAAALAAGSGSCRVLVTTCAALAVNEHEVAVPMAAAAALLARAIAQELQAVHVTHIDSAAPVAAVLDALAHGDDVEVAWRGDQRLVPLLAEASLAPLAQPPLLSGGHYLISGGLGGIGQLLAERFAQDYGAHVALIGRRPLVELDALAQAWLAKPRNRGSIVYAAADVCDATALDGALASLGPLWSAPLDGAFHLAAEYHETRVEHETVATLANTIGVKLDGARIVEQRVARRADALFVSFSSLLSELVGAEVGAYGAANRALEHAFDGAPALSGPRHYCLAWGSWRGIGMSRSQNSAEALNARGIVALDARQAGNALLAVLGQAPGTWLIGLNPEVMSIARRAPHAQLLERVVVAACRPAGTPPDTLLDDLSGQATCVEVVPVVEFPRDAEGGLDHVALLRVLEADQHAHVEPRDAIEARLKSCWQALFGIERISVEDSFFDLGGSSLLVTQLLGVVEAEFGCRWSMRDVFAAVTIAAQAEQVRAATGAAGSALIAPRPADVTRLPLSSAQRRMWFADRLERGDPMWNIHARVTWHSAVDATALGRALWQLCERHETLRTTFPLVDGEPLQLVAPQPTTLLTSTDLTAVPEPQRAAAAARIADAEARWRFDLSEGPLLRAQLLKLGEAHFDLLLTTHHVVGDGWSMRVMFDELRALYEAALRGGSANLSPLAIQYADFALWQHVHGTPDYYAEHLDYWRAHLRDVSTGTVLRGDRPRPAVRGTRGAQMRVPVPAAVLVASEVARQRLGVSQTVWMFACFAVVLRRWSGDPDVTVGTVVAQRDARETHDLIGMFANLAILRHRLDDEASFAQLCAALKETLLVLHEHAVVPYEMVVEQCSSYRDPQMAPLFQIGFDVRDERLRDSGDPNIELAVMERDIGRVQYDLHLTLEPQGAGMMAVWSYNTDLFDASTVARVADAFVQVANAAAAEPATPCARLPLLGPDTRRALLENFNANVRPFPQHCVHLGIAQIAQSQGQSVALEFEDRKLSYAQLLSSSLAVAAALQAAGVARGERVAIALERGPEMIIAMLGVLHSGAAFVPIDVDSPPDRIAYILDDAQARLVLCGAVAVPLPSAVPALGIAQAIAHGGVPSGPPSELGDLAYLIYTSGSTGRPKGVLLEHGGLACFAAAVTHEFGLVPSDRFLQFSSISFDAVVFEVFVSLSLGATLLLGSRETLLPGPPLAQFMRERRVTVAVLVPSVLQVLPADALPDLRVLISAGEALSVELAQAWAPGRRMLNAYGPTEATVCTTVGEVVPDGESSPDIGRPIPNYRVYLLDPWQQPVPVGVDGELWIGGPAVARGYHGRPDLSAERFCPDPHVATPGARMFRTGDFARWREDGRIAFVGRQDAQVKIRGVRIEIGEIEAAIARLPGVAAAVVMPDPRLGNNELVAFIAATGAEAVYSDSLRAGLLTLLPVAMIPARFHFVAAIPISTSGKADRHALQASLPPLMRGSSASSTLEVQSLEGQIATVWCEVLACEEVDYHANFFDIGGHSLKVAKVNALLQACLARDIPLIDHFRYTTVATLAEHLRGSAAAESPAEPGASRGERRQEGRAQLNTLRARRQRPDPEQ